ncbi:cell morphogenesis protein [Moniliophthora roreri MCA 2997]|uniref:Cell morphogenesis protein n=1 Tax=Moniliophthora roreri (strain MCA 2997) TaxID=1381753 RepID=V2XG14_MONRO|nr:cell morphogenesis protein [Moniliophthora roreri MCA 2997]
MSDSIQITIPDLGEDDFGGSNTTPFGRSGNGFGFGSGGGGFGQSNSPTLMTPVAAPERSERSYFSSHTRGDSVTSVESTGSNSARFAYPNRSQTSFATSTHSSTPTNGFSKKTSFASIRNAFKSGKTSEPPPLPQPDYILKNPFNRSTSSLNSTNPQAITSRGPLVTTSPPYGRPSTPSDGRFRATTYKKSHSQAKSFHSQSGSIFHISDGGSDGHGIPFPSSPPPVPRVPNSFGDVISGGDTPTIPDVDEDKVDINPKTPSDFALHAVFMRFASSAEAKIDTFLRQALEQDPPLAEFMGPETDPKFDDILKSLGQIAHKHAKPVLDSIMRWRRSQLENVGSEFIRFHMSQSSPSHIVSSNTSSNSGSNNHMTGFANASGSRIVRSHDVPGLLNERKSFAAIYIMCRALIAVVQTLGKDAIGENMGYTLEKTTFDQFRRPDLKLLLQSKNHRTNAELSAALLGHLANIRFVSVTDRFLAELSPIALGQVPKDLDMKYENLVLGLKHIQIKVWPPEAFEEGAEFMESLSKSFAHAHGHRLKSAFAETLVHIFHPIGKTAQAETNNPMWAKAIEMIYPKAREMATKPRYWNVAFPLVITSLCVAPENYFRKYWLGCFESAVSKLKEKSHRVPIMNGLMRLIWTYLYRCPETASTTATKLDGLLKYFFPPNRTSVYPNEDNLEPFILITHFVLSRHFEYGRDLCLELMQESAINSLHQSNGNVAIAFAPERTAIAVQAFLLSLHGLERESPTPTWPSSSDFFSMPSTEDYPSSSDFVPPSLLSKQIIQDSFNRCGSLLAIIANFCNANVGHMSVFDEQWSLARMNPNLSYEETHNFVVRKHLDGVSVAYHTSLAPQINMLQTCFKAWPRFLHESLSAGEAIDMLLRGMIHVEPAVGEVAREALKRFLSDAEHSLLAVSRFTHFLFSPQRISQEGTGTKLVFESRQLLDLWVTAVDGWVRALLKMAVEEILEQEDVLGQRCQEIEAGALFLMSHETRNIHMAGVKVIRVLGLLMNHISPEPSSPSELPVTFMLFVEQLHRGGMNTSYLEGFDELLEKPELMRLEQWKQSKRVDTALRIADSSNEKDRKLWKHVFPSFMQASMHYPAPNLSVFRDSLIAAASRYHPTISQLAGLSSRLPAGRSLVGFEKNGSRLVQDNRNLIDQWHMWVQILCATATLPDSTRPALTNIGRDHSRAPSSDASFERERLSTSRGLFRYLTPFLDSEYMPFRDAAVLCISSFPVDAYPQLLEDLSLLAGRQFYDDPRTKSGVSTAVEQNLSLLAARPIYTDPQGKANNIAGERLRRQERLHSAVARIYYLTAVNLQHQRSAGRQAALANVLKFVRNTQTFLTTPEMRDNHTLQLLRRYFCGTVERLFDGLATLKDSDRFIPPNMHLTLYRLCEEWCQFGPQSESIKQRLIYMEKAVAAEAPHNGIDDALEHFREETLLLSYAAVGAMSTLCHKAFAPPGVSSGSPTNNHSPDHLKPLSSSNLLERLSAILTSSHVPTQDRGKRALRAVLSVNNSDKALLDEALRRAIVNTDQADTNHERFFEVISEIVCSSEGHGFSFAQVVCLALSNLCHPLSKTRRQAFDMLEAIHHQCGGLLTMSQFEATIGSSASGTFVHSHRQLADFLAGEHPDQAAAILALLAAWLPAFPVTSLSNMVTVLLLQSLEFWISNIELMTEDRTHLSEQGHLALYHLMALTLRYGQSHPEQILVLWTRLVEPPNQSNGHATVRFLLEQSHKVGSTVFIDSAANIVACICQAATGREIFEEVCSVIEPVRMLPTIEHKLAFPDAHDMELWSDLDALFVDGRPRLPLGSAQFAWLFLAEVTLQRQWELVDQLPVLLHSLFTHLDNRTSYVRLRARRMLYQLLRSWAPGYDEHPDRSKYPNRSILKTGLAELEREAEEMYWKEEEKGTEVEGKMKWLCSRVITFLEPLCPSLRERWGTLALEWGTACSIRSIAFRSLQIFRALLPRVKMPQLALLLGRLSNTISAHDDSVKLFTTEIILTLNAVVSSTEFDMSLLPQIFWCTCASLSTTIEQEFAEVLNLLQSILERVDFDDPVVVEALLSHRPLEWKGNASLQRDLLPGLRSAHTSDTTLKILRILSSYADGRLIDATDARIRDLYTLSLPWCLHAMTPDRSVDDNLRHFAENIGNLAKAEGRQSIFKIMTSFAKGHFRTRDDFLRQSVSSLREHYGLDYWTEIVTLLMGLVLNQERWLRIQAMQILKVLFQQRETRSPVERLGSELLMPLLRLLESDLASQALDVLEEPMTMSGGIAAKHVLRMSMHSRTLPAPKDVDSCATVFGVPEESGWCVVKADEMRQTCRTNIEGVFDTCSMPSRPSRIEFEPEEVEALASNSPLEEDLGGLVQNLHDLTTFFQDDDLKISASISMPNRRLEARVAAILAKSTATDAVNDVPPTPFVDVFHVGAISSDEDSDSYSIESDSELDAFYFDSPAVYSSAPNGSHLH